VTNHSHRAARHLGKKASPVRQASQPPATTELVNKKSARRRKFIVVDGGGAAGGDKFFGRKGLSVLRRDRVRRRRFEFLNKNRWQFVFFHMPCDDMHAFGQQIAVFIVIWR
jgi:hypothetical protein